MDAQLTSPTSYRADQVDHPLSRIARQAFGLGAAVVLLLSVILVVRGMLGAFEAPESAVFLVLVAVTVELLAAVFRFVWLRLHSDDRRRRTSCMRLGVPSICVICLAIALSMADAIGWSVGSLWLIVIGGEFAWWYPTLRGKRHREPERVTAVVAECEVSRAVVNADECADEDEENISTDVIQQITRSRNSDGLEVISGMLRAEFLLGERVHNLHVAFCPPLAYEPDVIAHQLDGSPLTIKVGQVEIFGTRIELRRAAAAVQSESATIYFEVQPR